MKKGFYPFIFLIKLNYINKHTRIQIYIDFFVLFVLFVLFFYIFLCFLNL